MIALPMSLYGGDSVNIVWTSSRHQNKQSDNRVREADHKKPVMRKPRRERVRTERVNQNESKLIASSERKAYNLTLVPTRQQSSKN